MAERRAALAAGVVVLALAGCTPGGQATGEPGERTPTVSTPTVRTDAAPITKRFPALGTPADLHWQGAAAGTDTGGVPGPTDVRIQALVVVSEDVAAAAEKAHSWAPAPAGWDQQLSAELRPYAPKDADWQVSDAFTKEVTTTRYSGPVLFDRASRTVYLDVVGG